MIQRTLLTPFRVAGASIRVASRSTLLRSQCRTSNVSIVQRLRPVTAARWYATEPEQRKAPEGESEIAGEAQKECVQADDVAKKELEAKNKEIIDLKVCRHPDIFVFKIQISIDVNIDCSLCRTNTFDQLRTSEIFKNGRNAKCNQRRTSPSRSSPKT
jgi:hypothetical protein